MRSPLQSLGLALAAAALAAMLLSGCTGEPERPRRQQQLKLLPDQAPPPPPPPKQDEKPPPKPEDKPQAEVPKPADAPPQPQALKSDEAAGTGPGSGVTAGAVTQDYSNQKLGEGNVIGGGGTDNGAQRLAATAFGNATSRALNEFLLRDKGVKLRDYQVRVELYLSASGSLQRAELVDSTGDAQIDEALRTALSRFPGTGIAPPARLPQPLRVLVSNRLMG
jgi:periplasmic protein TonB